MADSQQKLHIHRSAVIKDDVVWIDSLSSVYQSYVNTFSGKIDVANLMVVTVGFLGRFSEVWNPSKFLKYS